MWPEDQEDDDQPEGEDRAHDEGDCHEPPLHESAGLIPLVGRIQGPHHRLHGSGERPEREQEADDDHDEAAVPALDRACEALSEQIDGALRHHRREVVEDRLHGIRPGKEAERSDGDEHCGGDRQKAVVGDRRSEVGHVVLEARTDAAIDHS